MRMMLVAKQDDQRVLRRSNSSVLVQIMEVAWLCVLRQILVYDAFNYFEQMEEI